MAIIEPLDFQTIFVNYLAGGWDLFFILSIVTFAYLGARFKMPNMAFMLLMALYSAIMAKWIAAPFVLVLFVAGTAIYLAISKLQKN